jgi:hypothetical protein
MPTHMSADLYATLRALASILPPNDPNAATIYSVILTMQVLGQMAFNTSANSGQVATIFMM